MNRILISQLKLQAPDANMSTDIIHYILRTSFLNSPKYAISSLALTRAISLRNK